MKQNRNWRLLAQYSDGKKPYQVAAYSEAGWKDLKQRFSWYVPDESTQTVILERPSEFDELAVGDWLHIEQMGNDSYWMLVGGYRLWVDLSGKSVSVTNDGKELSDYGVVRDE